MTTIINSADGKDRPNVAKMYLITPGFNGSKPMTVEDAIADFTERFGYEPETALLWRNCLYIQERETK